MKIPVFHSYGDWKLSGVSTWTVNMICGSRNSDFDHQILFTGIPVQSKPELDALGIQYHFLELPARRPRRNEWQELKRFLENRSPCIYIPNYDFHRSCAVGTLASSVKICAVIHSDEPCYYNEIKRLGKNFDAIVAVSELLAQKIQQDFPSLTNRLTHVPHGIPLPEQHFEPRTADGTLRLAYCNRLQQYQKRVFDLPPIMERLRKQGIPFHLTIAGEGPDESTLRQMFSDAGVLHEVSFLGRIPNSEVLKVFRGANVFLLTSDFEGLPISLLEAMSVGCVPVVYQMQSGISEAIEHDKSGIIVPHADVDAFVKALENLSKNRQKSHALGNNSIERVRTRFALNRMCEDYALLFNKLIQQDQSAQPTRTGKIQQPKDLKISSRVKKWILRNVQRN